MSVLSDINNKNQAIEAGNKNLLQKFKKNHDFGH